MAMMDKGVLVVKNGTLHDLEHSGIGRDFDLEFESKVFNFWNQGISVSTKEFNNNYITLCDRYREKMEALDLEFDDDSQEYQQETTKANLQFRDNKKELEDKLESDLEKLDISKTYLNLDVLTSESYMKTQVLEDGYVLKTDELICKKYAPQKINFNGLSLTIKRLNIKDMPYVYAVSFTVGSDKYTIIQGYGVSKKYYSDSRKEIALGIKKYLNNKVLKPNNKIEDSMFIIY